MYFKYVKAMLRIAKVFICRTSELSFSRYLRFANYMVGRVIGNVLFCSVDLLTVKICYSSSVKIQCGNG